MELADEPGDAKGGPRAGRGLHGDVLKPSELSPLSAILLARDDRCSGLSVRCVQSGER